MEVFLVTIRGNLTMRLMRSLMCGRKLPLDMEVLNDVCPKEGGKSKQKQGEGD
jgi:hypothetical protein